MRLERLLRPKSIAAIGGLQASRVIEQNQRIGYGGELWPVHPGHDEVRGLRCYRSVGDLPAVPDAAYIAVNRERTVEIVRALAAMGCGGAICYASGFLEADSTGGELQSALVEAAGEMPILGPNCYGLLNYAEGALLWPDQHGGRRLADGGKGVAIVSQSSNIAINFTMQKRGLPLAYVLTVGNQAVVGMSQLALALLDDPRVTALGIYAEGFDSIEGMQQLARRSRELGKPVVIYKVGKSRQSQLSALSHTASLVGSHAVTAEFLRRCGFGQADSIPVFLETLKLLHQYGPLPGYRVSSMSCSGGEASIIADAATRRRVCFPDLDEAQKAPLAKALGPLVAIANPLDYHTYSWANRAVMESTYSAMTALGFDLNYLILDFPHHARCEDDEWHIAVDAFEAALKKNQARGAFVVGMPENISEEYTENFAARGIVSFYGIDEALHATEIAADIGAAWRSEPPQALLAPAAGGGKRVTLDEADAKAALAAVGLPVPAGRRVNSLEQALDAAAELGYPLALKALGIAHKTERNALRLNLNCADDVARAARELSGSSGTTLYLEQMKPALAELIVGVTRDQQFGLVLTIGSGGILVELLRDAATLLIPAPRDRIETALAELRSAPLLAGYRGKPPADVDAAVAAIMAVQDYAIANSKLLIELDVNPLLIGARGAGVFAADALIVIEEQE